MRLCYLLAVFSFFFSILNGVEPSQAIVPKRPVILIIGTRPEAIKMIPVYQALQKENIPTILCSTGQHTELLDSAFSLFEVVPDFDLKIMEPEQSLFHITKAVLEKTEKLFKELTPSLVVVQGDTTSAMAAALAAFYLQIPVAHVEAGLRSGNIKEPFPEELNRKMISLLASYHFAPTEHSASKLLEEGIEKKRIFCTGNTVVDALIEVQKKIRTGKLSPSFFLKEEINRHQKLGNRTLLLTAHRRESLNGGLQNIFSGVKAALERYPNLHIIYASYPNPIIQKIIKETNLASLPNISIFSALPYPDMVYLLSHVDGVATDSGGIQEEAVSLSKPVLVLRNEIDRPEGLLGGAILVGTDPDMILQEIEKFMEKDLMISKIQPIYGDGHSSERVAKIIKNILKQKGSL